MTKMVPISALADDARTLSEEGFEARHGHAFLLLAAPALTEDKCDAGSRTSAVVHVGDIFLDVAHRDELLVAPLRSTNETGLVSVGRDPTNDVVLPVATVSHHHALLQVKGNVCMLRDVGSKAGTRLSHEPLPASAEHVPLHVGAHIAFGSVATNYLDARHLRLFLQQVPDR